MHRGTVRGRDVAEITLREMVAHLNVIDASVDAVGQSAGHELSAKARDMLGRFELLAFSAARLHIPDMARVTDSLEELVLAAHVRPACRDHEITAALRHGVDVLMLLTHDKMRRLQGHPGAELRAATDALLDRVDRLVSAHALNLPSPPKLARL